MDLLTLYDQYGRRMDMRLLQLFGLKLTVPSPSWTYETVQIDGMDGELPINKKLNPRTLKAEFYTKSGDYVDSLKIRDELYSLLMGGQSFYIGENNIRGKRWKVQAGDWTPERMNQIIQRFEIPLIARSGLAETIDDRTMRFYEPTFRIKNEGTYPINMRTQNETEFVFWGSYSDGLTIRNKTTGDEWRHNGSNPGGKMILIKGVRSTMQGQSIFGETNKRLLSLAPGWNDFEIEGADDGFELIFRTRFYFL